LQLPFAAIVAGTLKTSNRKARKHERSQNRQSAGRQDEEGVPGSLGPRAAWRLTGETIRPAQTGSNPVGGTGKRRRMNDTSNFKATGLSEQTLRSQLGAATTVAAGSVRKGHAFSGLQPLTVGEVGESFILNSLPVPASSCKMTRNPKTSSGCRNDPRRGQSGDPQNRLTREEAKIVKMRSP